MKKSKNSWGDNLLYFGLCIFSFGIVALIRIVITTAIKKAIAED